MKNIYEVRTANKIKSSLIVAIFIAFVFAATYILINALAYNSGYQAGGFGYVGIALIVSGISSFFSYYYSDKIILGIAGARPADRRQDFDFYTVAENIAIGQGLPKPKLYVVNDPSPNAFATGRDPSHAAVCVTTGLLEKLNRTELEGVIAHEMTHVKNFDTRLMSVVAVMIGLVTLLADWFTRSMFWGRGRDDREGNAVSILLLLGIVFAILSPIVGTLIQLAISRRREFMADAGSVEITRQPQGLISALEKISEDPTPLRGVNKATAHLYISNPFKVKGKNVSWLTNLFNTHPPIPERIKVLKTMA